MKTKGQSWRVRHKNRLLRVLMAELAGEAHISFEGDLRKLALLGLPKARQEETKSLRRNTIWPRQDFVVLPLERSTIETIIAAVGGTLPKGVIHVQIEKNGALQFGAYDRFHPQCIFLGEAITPALIESLTSEGILELHNPRASSRRRSS